MTFKTKELCTIALFVSITVILSQITIPIPFVPISLGILAVYISAIFLNPKSAAFSQIVYLFLGAIGLPVFAGFRGGISAIFGPTGGYLISYPLMAFFVSSFLESTYYKNINKNLPVFFAILISQIICYILGTSYLAFFLKISFFKALAIGVYPFILVDILKIIIIVVLVMPLRERIKQII